MSSRTAKILLYLVTALCLFGITMFRHSRQQADNASGPYTMLEGTVFHTIYHIQYDDTVNYNTDIQRLFREFDGSLSMFNDTSLITRVNQGDTSVIANHYLRTVVKKALEVSQISQGAFDITVAPLVNLWGFGFKNAENVSQQTIDSILQYVGYQKLHLLEDGHIVKDDPRMILDASSIAKGYMCDIVVTENESKKNIDGGKLTSRLPKMGENESKTPTDGGKLTSETDIDGGKLTSKPAFPTLLIKNVYELLKMNRKIKYSQMEDNLGVDENTIWRAVAWLKENGYINPERSKVKGEWQLL